MHVRPFHHIVDDAELLRSPLDGRKVALNRPEERFLRRGASLYLASSLFGGVHARRRMTLSGAELESVSASTRLSYSGERLDQRDLDALLAMLTAYLHTNPPIPQTTLWPVPTVACLQNLGRRPNRHGREWLRATLERLEAGRIEVHGPRYRTATRLLTAVVVERESDDCLVHFAPELVSAFTDIPGLDAFVRERLGQPLSPLAKWIHGLSWVVGGSYCIDMRRMRRLAGRLDVSPAEFNVAAMEALTQLTDAGMTRFWPGYGQRKAVVSYGGGHRRDQCPIYV